MAANNPLSRQVVPSSSCCQDELYLMWYLDSGAGDKRDIVLNPNHLPFAFGTTAVNDWPIYDCPDLSKAKIVARARGHHVQTDKHVGNRWFTTCNIVFEEESCYPGSTLVILGNFRDKGKQGKWAIVGGTGEFTLAHGAIFFNVVKKTNQGTQELKELHIGVRYTRMKESDLKDMFTEFNAPEIDDAINVNNRIGKGGYASVYKATIRNTTYAVKIHDKEWHQREFKQEVEILKRCRHENLVILIGACSKKLSLVYEYLPNGTLEDRLKKGESFSWEERVSAAISICTALEFLHNTKPNPIVHGDLKPCNILFDAKYVCKLGDFGISRLLKSYKDTVTPHHTTTQPKGTVAYMDPEFETANKLFTYSDIYALGIILLQLVTGLGATKVRGLISDKVRDFEKEDTKMRTEMICTKLVDTRLTLNDDKQKDDAVRMVYLGLDCSRSTGKERPSLSTEVRPQLQSMINHGIAGTSTQTSDS